MAYGSRDEGLVLYSKSVCVDGALLYRVTQYLWVLYGPTVGLLYQFKAVLYRTASEPSGAYSSQQYTAKRTRLVNDSFTRGSS